MDILATKRVLLSPYNIISAGLHPGPGNYLYSNNHNDYTSIFHAHMLICEADLFVLFLGWTGHYDMEPQDLCVKAVVGKGGSVN